MPKATVTNGEQHRCGARRGPWCSSRWSGSERGPRICGKTSQQTSTALPLRTICSASKLRACLLHLRVQRKQQNSSKPQRRILKLFAISCWLSPTPLVHLNLMLPLHQLLPLSSLTLKHGHTQTARHPPSYDVLALHSPHM